MTLYAWQEEAWQKLMKRPENLHHALLLTGEMGIGKRHFADYLAQYLLCEEKGSSTHPCGYCSACLWFKAGNHPDYRLVSLSEEVQKEEVVSKKATHWITVETIRALQDFLHIGAHRRGRRVVVVDPADSMNITAANALLKVLEEPPSDLIFILVSHRWQRLLPTIKSRCFRVALPMPTTDVALAWLQEKGMNQPLIHLRHCAGAPLKALTQLDAEQGALLNRLLAYLSEPKKTVIGDLVGEIDKLKVETLDIIDCLQKWVLDSVLYQQAAKIRYYPDYEETLSKQGRFGSKFWVFYRMLVAMRRHALHPLNQKLLLEKIFYQWIDVLKEAKQNEELGRSS